MRSTRRKGADRGSSAPSFREENQKKTGRRKQLAFRVLLALVAGSVLAFIIYSIPKGLYDSHITPMSKKQVSLILLSAGISWFIGGLFSGWIVEYEVRHRRWRFLWLALASPAMPAWLFALWGAATQHSMSGLDSARVIVMVLAACLGSAYGYCVGRHRRMWWKRRWRGY